MGNMRTMAFQVPEELFQKIKNYLQRNNMTQKQFVIGLIETEINRDLEQRVAQQNTAVSGGLSERSTEVVESAEEQTNGNFEGVSDGESEGPEDEELDAEDIDEDEDEDVDEDESENLDAEETEDIDEDQDESEDQRMSMGM